MISWNEEQYGETLSIPKCWDCHILVVLGGSELGVSSGESSIARAKEYARTTPG